MWSVNSVLKRSHLTSLHRFRSERKRQALTDAVHAWRYKQVDVLKSHLWGQNDDLWERCFIRYRLLSALETEMKCRKWRKHEIMKICSHGRMFPFSPMTSPKIGNKGNETQSHNVSKSFPKNKKQQRHNVAQISVAIVSNVCLCPCSASHVCRHVCIWLFLCALT